MTPTFYLIPAAERDLDEAASWYDDQRAGLGNELLDEAYEYFDRIADQPQIYAIVYRKARQAILNRFPYAVYFATEPKRIVVYAVIHTARDPAIWQSRVP